MSTNTKKTSEKPPPFFNIALFVVLVGSVSWWFLHFIGLLPSLVPVAGVISWAVVKIIPERTFKGVPKIAERFFLSASFRRAWLGVLSAWLLVGFFVGTVNVHCEEARTISIGREGRMSNYAVASLGEAQIWFWTVPFFPATIWVDDQRLPALPHRLKPWHADDIWCPRDLFRPVLLLRPSRQLIASLLVKPYRVEVRRNHSVIAGAILDGHHAVLVGARHVWTPDEVRKAWTEELRPAGALDVLDIWTNHVAVSPDVTLSSGEELEIEVKFPNGSTRSLLQIICGRPDRPDNVPQVVDLS